MNQEEKSIRNFWLTHGDQEEAFNTLLKYFPWAEEYVYCYIYVMYAIRASVPYILEGISVKDRTDFSYEKAYYYLKKYEAARLKLAIVIPTYNRPDAVAYIIKRAAILYRRYGVDAIFYDSSNDDKTKKVVEEARQNGYYNVIYRKYEGVFDGFSLDHKVISAYQEFGDEYEYLWLCRDGLVPLLDEIIERLRHCKRQNIGCIIVDTKSRNDGVQKDAEYKERKDCERFLRDQATRLQTLGMLIFSSQFAKELIEQIPLDHKTYSLWQMSAPFHLFAQKPYRILFFTMNVFDINYCACATHFWSKAEKALKQWGYHWSHIIECLPKEYEHVKTECLMVYTVDFHPFTICNLLEMRGWGGLNLSLVNQYENDLKKTTQTPISYIKVIACMPKLFARIGNMLISRFPKFTHKIRNMIFHRKEL